MRSEAAKRGFDPEKIGATGISAGAKALLLVATSSLTPAYAPVGSSGGWGSPLKSICLPTADTGSYTYLDRIWEFMNHKGYNAR